MQEEEAVKRPAWMPGISLTEIMIRWRNDINNLRGCPCALSNKISVLQKEKIFMFLNRKNKCSKNNV